jgi:hypothetical protein
MKRLLMPALIALAAIAFVPVGSAADIPFPAAHTGDVFVIAQTVTTVGAMSNYFVPGDTVRFRAYAVDGKTHKVLTANAVRYFYATIPNQPNVKFKYDAKAPGASGQYTWTGSWTVPATYPTGLVDFKVLVQAKSKLRGSFVQMPVATAQLTISTTPMIAGGAGPGTTTGPTGAVKAVLYADSVNGTRPAAAAPRPVGCTQTNVYRRGEQFVLRMWGFEMSNGAVLSLDNVSEAHFAIAGQPNVTMNWGSHGTAKVFFWTNAWQIPVTYPLGDTTVHASFTLTSGTVATLDYPITIIP